MLQPKPKPAADPKLPKELGKPTNPPCQIARLRFSPCGTVLAAGGYDATVRRWDATGAELADLPPLTGFNGWVTALAFGGKALFAGDSWGALAAFDAAAKEPKKLWAVADAHPRWLRGVAVSPDAATLATCGLDGKVRLWAAADGKKLAEFPVGADATAVAFGPDGKQVVVGDVFGVVRVLDRASGKVARTLDAKELYKTGTVGQDVGGVKGLLFDAAGKTLFVHGGEVGRGGFVQSFPLLLAFDWATGKRGPAWKGASDNEGYVTDLAWHPTGYVLGTTSGQPGQGRLFLWKPGEVQPFAVVAKPNVHSVTLHPGGGRAAISATNAGSSGNGKPKGKNGEYPENYSPVSVFELPKATA